MIIYFLTFSLSGVILEDDSSANLNITILQFSRIYYKLADQIFLETMDFVDCIVLQPNFRNFS